MCERTALLARLRQFGRRLLQDGRGATAVEYGLIISLIVLAVLVGIIQVANTTTTMWNNVSNQVQAAR